MKCDMKIKKKIVIKGWAEIMKNGKIAPCKDGFGTFVIGAPKSKVNRMIPENHKVISVEISYFLEEPKK